MTKNVRTKAVNSMKLMKCARISKSIKLTKNTKQINIDFTYFTPQLCCIHKVAYSYVGI